jgi:chromosome segregation ATPase
MTKLVDLEALARDNHQAEREHAEWLEEIQRWRSEQRRVLGWLSAVHRAWRDAEKLLADHAETIRSQEACLHGHEASVAKHQRDELRSVTEQLLEDHRVLAAKHAEARRAHEEIRARHYAVVSEVRELLRTALGGAVVPEWVSRADGALPDE